MEPLLKQIKIQAKELVKKAKADAAQMSKDDKRQCIKLAKLTAREMIANAKLEEAINVEGYDIEKQINDIKDNAKKVAEEICAHDISIGKANRTAFHHTLLEMKRKLLNLKTKFKNFVTRVLGVNIDELNEKIKNYNYSEIIKNFTFFEHADGSVSGMTDVKMCISEHMYTYKELFAKWYNREYSFSKLIRVLIAKLTNLSSDVINAIINKDDKKEDKPVENDAVVDGSTTADTSTQEDINTNKGFNQQAVNLSISH